MPTKLSVSECLRFGWDTFKSRPWFFVSTILIYAVAQLILSGVQDALDWLGIILSIIGGTLLYIGFLNVYLKAHDAPAAAHYRDLWKPGPFWNYLILSILLFVLVGIGLVLLIVPGIILALMFSFSGFLVIEKGMGPIEALKESARRTKGNRWKLFLLGIALALLSLVGMIPLFLGLLIVGPVAMLASVHAYRTLSGAKETVVTSPA